MNTKVEIDYLRAELAAARAEIALLRETWATEGELSNARADAEWLAKILERIQWCANIDGWNGACPICSNMNLLHTKDCELGSALTAHRAALEGMSPADDMKAEDFT